MDRTRHPLRFVQTHVAALLAAFVLVLAACGSGGQAAGAGAEGDPTTTTIEDPREDDDHDGGGEDGAVEVDEPALRLLVADSETGQVLVLDLATGNEIDTLELRGPARLYPEPHGRYVVAAQASSDLVDWIDSGTWTVGHGDHGHHWTASPRVTDWQVEAARPAHVVFHDDLLTVFNDGDGSYWVVDTHHLGDDDALLGTWQTGVAHHGVAVALEDLGVVIASIPGDDPDDALPIGVMVIDLETGEEIDRFENCPGLHGEYATDKVVAFGCADGVLLVGVHGDHWDGDKVPNPAGTPEGTRTGTLRGGHGLDYMIGNLGPDSLVRIDLGTQTSTAIALPLTAAAWTFDAATEQILVLTVDGAIHLIDPATGDLMAAENLTDPIELPEGHGGPPRPSIIVAGNRAYVADPANQQVIEVAIAGELRPARTFATGFAPQSLAVAGQSSH